MKKSGLNILVTTPHFPYPLIGGERIKLFNLVKHLSENNKLFLVSLDRGYEIRDEYVDVIHNLGIETYTYKINKLTAITKAAFFTIFRNPLEIEYFNHSGFNNKINEIKSNHKIDLIINLFVRTAESVKSVGTKKILLAEDCRSYYQKRIADVTDNLLEEIRRNYDSKKLAKYESEIMNQFDITTVVTEDDLSQMKMLNSNADIRIFSQGVDSDYFKPDYLHVSRKDILFLGKLDMLANIMMVKLLAEKIFPLILQKLPDAKLIISGSSPGSEILKLQSDSITIYANPKNIAECYQASAVFIHPHCGGSGIQNKVLEAMSSGCVVITSPSGANGIGIVNGTNAYIANNYQEFADIAVELLQNPEKRQFVGDNARQYILKNKSWENELNKFDKIIEEL
jgi:polysaccharide biosynthesis protein PslH